MKSPEEIKDMIAEIESDERYSHPPANVFSNAPLALIQVEMKAKVEVLKWVLGDRRQAESSKKARRS